MTPTSLLALPAATRPPVPSVSAFYLKTERRRKFRVTTQFHMTSITTSTTFTHSLTCFSIPILNLKYFS